MLRIWGNGEAMSEVSEADSEQLRLDRLQIAAQATTRVLDLALALTKAGRRVDLAGIDNRIGQLCAQALDLPPGLGAALVPSLRALIAKIAVLKPKIT